MGLRDMAPNRSSGVAYYMKLSQHFSRVEFTCGCGCGYNTVDAELIEILEEVRRHFSSPISINSAARCHKHNKKVGGKPSSQHLLGKAADIAVKGVDSSDVADYAEILLRGRGGIGRYNTFTHIDVRESCARW